MNKYKYVPTKHTSEVLAYFAGIIDGEGSFFIGNFSSNPKTGTPHYQTCIQVANTDKILIDWLYDNFGGERYTYTPKQLPKGSRKPVYSWKANGERLTHLCNSILPYLVIKKDQAELMLKMRATFTKTGVQKGKQGIQPVTQEIADERLSYFKQLQKLHTRNRTEK